MRRLCAQGCQHRSISWRGANDSGSGRSGGTVASQDDVHGGRLGEHIEEDRVQLSDVLVVRERAGGRRGANAAVESAARDALSSAQRPR
eukprot:685310-Prymnesium_polylepis.1